MGRFFAREIAFLGRKSILSDEPDINFANVRSGLLAKAYAAKDKVVIEALHQASSYLGIGVANMITMLGPDTVVIGGGVFEALGKDLLPIVQQAAKEVTHPPSSFKDTRIVMAELGDDAVAMGAVAYARHCHRNGDK